jgi:hypothetical protein
MHGITLRPPRASQHDAVATSVPDPRSEPGARGNVASVIPSIGSGIATQKWPTQINPTPLRAATYASPTRPARPLAGSTVTSFDMDAARRAAQRSVDRAMKFFLHAGLGIEWGVGPARLRIYRPGERATETTNSNPSPWLDGSRVIRLDFHDGISDAFRPDIVAHEYAHGVVERFITSRTVEADALNEALADIFAVAIEGRDESVDGRSLMTGDGYWNITQLPSGARPGRRPRMDEHLVMGIATRPAAYVLRRSGRAAMAQIYMDAMRTYMRSMPHTFAGLALATLRAAADRYGTQSEVYRALRDGWNSTGLTSMELRRRLPRTYSKLLSHLP